MYETSGIIEGKDQQGGFKKDGVTKWTRTSYTIDGKKYSTFDTTNYEIGEEVKLKVEDKTLDTGAIVHNINEIVKKDEKFASNEVTSEDKVITPEQTVQQDICNNLRRIATAVEKIAKEYPPGTIVEEKVE